MNPVPLPPVATYRLQFHAGFGFEQARALVPYLDRLGISHVYASPLFRAAPGSSHGYDVCDPNALNPEMGTRAEFDAFAAALAGRGMGLVMDFVPNHMGIAEPHNPWWMDVLENGPASPYAAFFDIDWQPLKRELENKVLLPILSDQYGRILERGELRVGFEAGSFFLCCQQARLPLAPRSIRPLLQRAVERLPQPPPELESIITALNYLPQRTETGFEKRIERGREKEIIRERLARLCAEDGAVSRAITQVLEELHDRCDPGSFDRLDALISSQAYRPSFWRVAAEEINYRRFFDINSMAALRVELPAVFEATHQLLFELAAAGTLSGIRIDHIDGLANPLEYLQTLQGRLAALRPHGSPAPVYLVVEKILASGEQLPAPWPVAGTTGYEFAAQSTALQVDPDSLHSLDEAYTAFTGLRFDCQEIIYRCKRLVMQTALAAEINSLGHLLNRLSESNRWYRDFTVNALTAAVREVIACFPVYRTYLAPGRPAEERDQATLLRAISLARRRNPALERSVFEFVRDVLLPPPENAHPVDEELRRAFVLKFQQCTAPVAAKGVEDTAFYICNRLIAANEVGADPAAPALSPLEFHQLNRARQACWPQTMLATSTHDTKRSEDVRARIAALSELPLEWLKCARSWRAINRRHKTRIDGESAPDANEEYHLYQTLLGSWPMEGLNEANLAPYRERIQAAMTKALREAKVNTSWIEPNEAWESAMHCFVDRLLDPARKNPFPASCARLASRLARLGAVNSLSQTVLKLTVPGVPDFYQGCELWDLSLVDPDNRRPVDFIGREAALDAMESNAHPGELLAHWCDGRIKLFVIRTLLHFRRTHRGLFDQGRYEPLQVSGIHQASCLAFERIEGPQSLLVVVPRLSARVGFPPTSGRWRDTFLEPLSRPGQWRDLFTSTTHPSSDRLSLAQTLATLPVAVLAAESNAPTSPQDPPASP